MIFLDANVLMYAAGSDHPYKAGSTALLDAVANGRIEATTSAEILQEILHRYRAIGRWQDGRRVYDLARKIVGTIVPVTVEMTDRARVLLDDYPRLMARDALHAATCQMIGAELCSYDADFDAIVGITRRTPEQLLAAAESG